MADKRVKSVLAVSMTIVLTAGVAKCARGIWLGW